MKYILITFLLIAGNKLYAQVDLPISCSQIISSDSAGAKQIFKKAESYLHLSKNKFYRTNGERNAGWELVTGPKASDKSDIANAKMDLGFESSDAETNTVIGHCTFRYEGSMMSSPRLMFVKADIIIKCKDGRSKIEITDFSYDHYNLATGKPQQLADFKDSGPCSSHGSLEKLSKCDCCYKGLSKMSEFIYNSCKSIIKEYTNYVNQPISSDNW